MRLRETRNFSASHNQDGDEPDLLAHLFDAHRAGIDFLAIEECARTGDGDSFVVTRVVEAGRSPWLGLCRIARLRRPMAFPEAIFSGLGDHRTVTDAPRATGRMSGTGQTASSA